jgi:hypothetical protein
MLTKAEIARHLNNQVNTSYGELVQFFYSTFYKEGLSEEEYLSAYTLFITELDEYLLNNQNWSLDDTFLKGRTFTTTKLPLKVRKQMELDYKEAQAYIEQINKELNNQD